MLMGGLESTDVVMNALQTSVYVKCTHTAVGASWSGQRSIPIFAFLNRVSVLERAIGSIVSLLPYTISENWAKIQIRVQIIQCKK